MGHLWPPPGGEEEDESDGEEFITECLPPGASASSAPAPPVAGPKAKSAPPPPSTRAFCLEALRSGVLSAEIMPLLMMELLEGKGGRGRGGIALDEEADGLGVDEDVMMTKGLAAIRNLARIKKEVSDNPGKVIREFEREVCDEMGIVPGQPWTLRDWARKQNWGRFRGLYRGVLMDIAAYEKLRRNQTQQAAAQLIQNIKAKRQSMLQGGDWTSAWLLTGLPDPVKGKEFAGTEAEMAATAEYLNSLADLRKKVKAAGPGQQNAGPEATLSDGEGEAEDGNLQPGAKRRPRKGARAKAEA